MQLKNKVIVVTGSGNGIGRELVIKLLQTGARVASVDIDEKGLQQTRELSGAAAVNLSTHILDITDKQAVEKLPEAVLAKHQQVDGLINCAGIIQRFVRFNELPYENIEKVLDVNLYGTLYMTKTFLPLLLQRPEGVIANVSSMGGYVPVPGQTIYGASKAAVKLFTEGLYSELLDTNVRVSIIFPGAIATNIAANSGAVTKKIEASPKMKMTTAPRAAELMVRGIEKNRFRIFVGSDAKMMDLLYRLMPKKSTHIIYSQMGALLKL